MFLFPGHELIGLNMIHEDCFASREWRINFRNQSIWVNITIKTSFLKLTTWSWTFRDWERKRRNVFRQDSRYWYKYFRLAVLFQRGWAVSHKFYLDGFQLTVNMIQFPLGFLKTVSPARRPPGRRCLVCRSSFLAKVVHCWSLYGSLLSIPSILPPFVSHRINPLQTWSFSS